MSPRSRSSGLHATPSVPRKPSAGLRALSSARAWLASDASFPFHLFVFTRAILCLTSWFGLRMVPALYLHEDARQMVLKDYPAIDGLCRWDCGWFVKIVQEGFITPEHAKVFPLLPMLGYAFDHYLGIHYIVGFLIVSNAASLASYFVLFGLFKELEGVPAARAALVLFAAYPFAFYQAAAYPESMMILATSGAIVLARKKRHFAAGLVLGLGTMARHLTLSGGAGLIAAHLRQRGRRPLSVLFDWSVLSLLIPWVMIALFSWHLKVKTGDPIAFWTSRSIGWHNGEPWWGVRQIFEHYNMHEHAEYFSYVLVAVIPTIGTVALLFKTKYFEIAAHAAVLLAVILTSGAAGLGRYSASVWPAFLPLGVYFSKRPNLFGPAVLASALFQGMFFFLFSHQFKIL